MCEGEKMKSDDAVADIIGTTVPNPRITPIVYSKTFEFNQFKMDLSGGGGILSLLMCFSIAVFTLPFFTFFATKYICYKLLNFDALLTNLLSVIMAVLVVNVIIFLYIYGALKQPFEEIGNSDVFNNNTFLAESRLSHVKYD